MEIRSRECKIARPGTKRPFPTVCYRNVTNQHPALVININTSVQGPQRLFHHVYTLAQNEAREARERRGLPFGGLFGPAEQAAIQQNDIVRMLPTENAARGRWAGFFSF